MQTPSVNLQEPGPEGSYQTADGVRIELVTYPPRNNSQNPGWQLLTWKEVTAPERTC